MELILRHPVFRKNTAAPSSKSHLHRLVLCAVSADRETTISFDGNVGDDLAATLDCARALGASITLNGSTLTVVPPKAFPERAVLPCRSSGTTLRFFTALCAGLQIKAELTFAPDLAVRPMDGLLGALEQNGAVIEKKGGSLFLEQGVSTCDFTVAGNVSSQFISGLLFACAVRGGTVHLSSPAQSAGYIDMTLDVLRNFGCTAERTREGYSVCALFPLRSRGDYTAEGDWSNAAYALIGGAIGSRPVSVSGLSPASAQGDKRLLDLLTAMGADLIRSGETVTVLPSELNGITADGRDIPDIVLPLCIAACAAQGETVVTGIERLRYKETDRIDSLLGLIRSLGGQASYDRGMLRVTGTPLLGGRADGRGDHRTVMTAALAATVCQNDVTVSDAEAVKKSYPLFFSQFSEPVPISFDRG